MVRGNGKVKFAEVRGVRGGGGGVRGGGGPFLEEVILRCLSREYLLRRCGLGGQDRAEARRVNSVMCVGTKWVSVECRREL